MNLSSMEYFVALARERSFTRAAERLHITQQSLSAHVAALEKELGCQLILRRVPLELTYAGEVFLGYAASFQRQLTALHQEFGDIAGNQKGVLRLGVAFTRGRAILPPLIKAFRARFPQIDVHLTEDANDALHQSLLRGDIDLAIANFPQRLSGISLRDFYREEVVLLVPGDFLDRLDEAQASALGAGDLQPLAECPFVLGDQRDIAGRIGREVLAQAGIKPQVAVTSGNVETLLALCVEGVGNCFCPENLARASLTQAQLDRLRILRLGDAGRCMIRFGYLEGSYQWSIISEFMETAMQNQMLQ